MSASLLPLLSLLSGSAAACATCFGGGDSGLNDGIWWGIVLLLSATFTLVGGFAYTLWRVERARARAENA